MYKRQLKGSDLEQIKAKQDELQKALYDVSSKIYQQAAPQQQAAPGAAPEPEQKQNDGVVDVDYTEVDDQDKK